MARISASKAQAFTTAATSHPFTTMPTHASGELLIAHCVTDLGTGTLSASGWTEIGTQVSVQAQRSAWFYKVAASGSETFTLSLTTSLAAIVTIMTVQGADTADIVNGENRNDSGSSAGTSTSPALTTDEDNCLVIYAWGYDGSGELGIQPDELTYVSKTDSSIQQIVGFRNQRTAGAIPSATATCYLQTEGGTAMVLALNDDGTGKFAPEYQGQRILRRYGGMGQSVDSANTNMAASDLADSSITSITGVSASANPPNAGIDNVYEPLAPWNSMSRIRWTTAVGSGMEAMYGVFDSISSTDFSGKVVSLMWQAQSVSLSIMGSKGYLIGFEDSSGNWAVFQLAGITSDADAITFNVTYVSFIGVDSATPYDSSGTIDWTDIVGISHIHHRQGTSAGVTGLLIKDLSLFSSTVFTSGAADDESTPKDLPIALEGWGSYRAVGQQVPSQLANKSSFQIGDGTTPTFYKASATAYALPEAYVVDTSTRFWNVPASQLEFRIKASASDSIDMSASLMTTTTRQTFIIDPASSTSATYNFSGFILVGYDPVGQTGITFNGATFDACYQLTLNGGGLDGAVVSNSLSSTAAITDDPSAISDTQFISAGSGHAIELTGTGTFDFFGNTFTDYGSDATTDAAIYNNSGGAVTLTLAAGDPTPTVLNGAGASTNFAYPAVNITVSGYTAGSRVQIYNVTQNTEIYNDTPAGTSYDYSVSSEAANNDVIRVRVAYLGKIPSSANGTFSSTNGVSFLIEPAEDTVYTTYGVDGSAVTTISWDGVNIQIDINEADDTWSAKDLYAWYNYYVTTSTGITDVFGLVTAINAANLELGDVKLDNVRANTALEIAGVRIYRSDEANPVVNPTSGGGGLTLYSTGEVFIKNINTATNVITGDIADVPTVSEIADGVWDEPLSGHTTAGTTGKALKDSADSAELASIK